MPDPRRTRGLRARRTRCFGWAVLFACLLGAADAQPPATSQQKGAARDTFRVLSWNIYMLPPLVKWTGKRQRARAIADVLCAERYDVLVLQEAFHKGARRILLQNGLAQRYPYRYGPANSGGCSLKTSSGVWILSRHPLSKLGTTQFEAVATWDDKLARKGGLMVACNFRGLPIQILGTHLNAGGPPHIRLNQAMQLRDSLLQPHARPGVPQLVCGDMNTARRDSALYIQLRNVLQARRPLHRGPLQYTADSRRNDLKDAGQREVIDYIFIREQGAELWLRNRIREFERPWGRGHRDLSDHFAVETRVVFEE
jgi:endonuclease/exonuclease/phosphatase family metal-dependent hydrolase